MADLFKYRIYCNTESAYVTGWYETEPTVCPNNNTHNIDSTSVVIIEQKLDEGPTDVSGKPRVHQTSRRLGTTTYWTGAGDDPSNPVDIGGGELFNIQHDIDSTATIEYKYIDFNCVENMTYVHEGHIVWKDAYFDMVSLELVPRTTPYSAGSNTNYNLYGGYLIVPAAGDGTIDLDQSPYTITDHRGGLVYMTNDDEGNLPVAFWNADWNTSTKEYENITAAPNGDGRYNMFAVEVKFARFVNRISLLGDGFEKLQSADADEIGHGMRFKIITETHGNNHHWDLACILTFHRERTS
ncbi:hypothetical protein KAR91_16100 [Candidatus Pacearchaeota archaeon]|nr:hypothetical protein [Candidatus Pacearchaeota archaeon]